ncbi:MAG TPA: tetratricopeptide repeat protein [Burkholderiaceae bacterium]
MSLRTILLCCALAAMTCAPLHAQDTATQQDLYLEAMKSIAEGRAQDADDTLSRMVDQEPQHAGAWLDLAIIQCELGHAEEAERLFHAIETRFSPPPGIMEVIIDHRATGCKGLKARNVRNKFSVLLGRGFDSNVNQGASSPYFSLGTGDASHVLDLLPQYLPQHDQYTLFSANYIRDLDQNGTLAFTQFQARENDNLRRYDTISLLVGIDKPWRAGAWGLHTIATAGVLSLGDEQYQRQVQFQAKATPPAPLPDHFQFNLVSSLSHVEYPTLANFNSTTDEADAQLAYQDKKTSAQANLGVMFDHGNAAYLGGNRRGWQASALANTRLGENVNAEFGWTQQYWDSQRSYSPGLIDQVRRQNTQIFRAGVIVPLEGGKSLQVEWRRVRNNENISLFEYSGQLLQVSLKWQNF